MIPAKVFLNYYREGQELIHAHIDIQNFING